MSTGQPCLHVGPSIYHQTTPEVQQFYLGTHLRICHCDLGSLPVPAPRLESWSWVCFALLCSCLLTFTRDSTQPKKLTTWVSSRCHCVFLVFCLCECHYLFFFKLYKDSEGSAKKRTK